MLSLQYQALSRKVTKILTESFVKKKTRQDHSFVVRYTKVVKDTEDLMSNKEKKSPM